MKIVITYIAFLISIASFAQPQESITPEKMKQDIVLLKSVLYNLHPGLYKYNTREDIEMYFSDLAAIASKEMPLTDFYLKVSQLVNKVKCGHTFPNPLNLDDDTKKILFQIALFLCISK
ncbi:MAG: hypothetical protein HC892_09825 [Saprospiraceae bacterium]|nr:hypothetical protein [Saprospiraceae bacterium]